MLHGNRYSENEIKWRTIIIIVDSFWCISYRIFAETNSSNENKKWNDTHRREREKINRIHINLWEYIRLCHRKCEWNWSGEWENGKIEFSFHSIFFSCRITNILNELRALGITNKKLNTKCTWSCWIFYFLLNVKWK